jgi:uncharacterized repeat protein (TIGR03803 family)
MFGMTYGGGANGIGTVFQMNTDGSGFSLLHSFAGGATDGKRPFGSLVLGGSTLYGMTERGGLAGDGLGTVFSIAAPILPGDYNNDGKVDAADYVVWRKYSGTTNPLPNDPIGGTIGLAQFNQWRDNFGAPGSGSSPGANGPASATVPEPASLLIMAIGLFLMTHGNATACG